MLDLFTTVAYATETGATPDPGSGSAGLMGMVGYIALMFAVFYFVLIRPQKKQEKKMKEMLAAVKVGDKVITAGGIAGKIVKIKDDFVWVETGFVGNPDKQSTLKLEKAAIKIVEASEEDK